MAMWIQPDWIAPPGVRALSTLRTGGVSAAPFQSLNLGAHVGDDPDAVSRNRLNLRQAAALPAPPRWLQQVHGTDVADLDTQDEAIAMADAAVSSRRAVVCAVLTADCLPVLLAAADGSAVGVVHAGWRGLAAGVIEAAAGALRTKVASGTTLQAWLGPAIGTAHFEVGADVLEAFTRHDGAAASAFTPNAAGRWQCDLYLLARQRLRAMGVENISGGAWCTYSDPVRFYSHRRDVQHRGQPATGRMATLIWRE
jgi:YfiH family protein